MAFASRCVYFYLGGRVGDVRGNTVVAELQSLEYLLRFMVGFEEYGWHCLKRLHYWEIVYSGHMYPAFALQILFFFLIMHFSMKTNLNKKYMKIEDIL